MTRSAIAGLTTMGARVTVCGPGTLLPADDAAEQLAQKYAPVVVVREQTEAARRQVDKAGALEGEAALLQDA